MKAADRCLFACLVTAMLPANGCSRESAPTPPIRDYSVIELMADRQDFLSGAIGETPSQGDFFVIVELTPAKDPDAQKLADLCRAGHPISLQLRESPDAAPFLVSDVTSRGEAIIRCETRDEAQRVMVLLDCAPRTR